LKILDRPNALGRRRLRWEDNIKIDRKEGRQEGVDKGQWRDLVNMVMNFRFPQSAENFLWLSFQIGLQDVHDTLPNSSYLVGFEVLTAVVMKTMCNPMKMNRLSEEHVSSFRVEEEAKQDNSVKQVAGRATCYLP
jgi:hypothetical protein